MFSATLGAFSMGCCLGYSSPAGIQLLSNSTTDDNIHLTLDQNAWFSSTFNIGALVGGPIGGVCARILGRKGTLLILPAPFLAGWGLVG